MQGRRVGIVSGCKELYECFCDTLQKLPQCQEKICLAWAESRRKKKFCHGTYGKSQIHFKIKTSVNLGFTFDLPNKFSQLLLANEENFKRDFLHLILILFTVGKYTVTFHVAYHYLFFPRVSKATKENENVQLSKTPLRSSSSVLELDRLHSKKIKKHINGLRRAVSSTSIGTSRTFAPRSS